MRNQIDQSFPGEALVSHHGGSALWLKGPDNLDSRELAVELEKEGVLIEPGDVFFYDKDQQTPKTCPYFRLGYSSLPEERIAEGIKKVIKKVKQLTKDS